MMGTSYGLEFGKVRADCLSAPPRVAKDHTRFLALGHSKGNPRGAFGRSTDLICPLSRHRENG